jgi:hypothetical protein
MTQPCELPCPQPLASTEEALTQPCQPAGHDAAADEAVTSPEDEAMSQSGPYPEKVDDAHDGAGTDNAGAAITSLVTERRPAGPTMIPQPADCQSVLGTDLGHASGPATQRPAQLVPAPVPDFMDDPAEDEEWDFLPRRSARD